MIPDREIWRAALAAMLSIGSATMAMAGDAEDCASTTIAADRSAAACRRLAEQGTAFAQFDLGLMYNIGRGVPQGYVQAHLWLSLAIAAFTPGFRQDIAIEQRSIAASKMTPAQVEEAQQLAAEWKPKPDSRGDKE